MSDLKDFAIRFKQTDKYEDVAIKASQMNVTEAFVCFVTFGDHGEYSCVSYALSEVFSVVESGFQFHPFVDEETGEMFTVPA
jgi:hypothetical protein